ncbi:MAG: pyruvate, phosphate dikinase [Alphaproteobacteria bacterium]|nr:pyruvate, phosphate dikinase [Alphaproteobacteria bacterium]
MPIPTPPFFYIATGEPAPAGSSVDALGGKAFGLLRLSRLGLPVPPSLTLGTSVCRDYFAAGGKLPPHLREDLVQGVSRLEATTSCRFGAVRRPLLVSVRSGAPVSMPGMMDTILNVGLSEASLRGLLRATGNPRLARDCYRRFIRDFCGVVHGTPADEFERLVAEHCAEQGVADVRELDTGALDDIARQSLEVALALTGRPFPQDPMDQLLAAVEAVFRSWHSDRARAYRKLHAIDDALGTAVTIQAMVFGNAGATSGAGVGFTRDPATGEDKLYLDFLFNAQGEDVVSGRRSIRNDTERLSSRLPAVLADLARVKRVLEDEFRDVQDFEFTVENGRLHLLQVRPGKRTAWAALKIAADMVREGRITPAEALTRVAGLPLDRLERCRLAGPMDCQPLAHAVPAGGGVVSGAVAFDTARVAALGAQGRAAILVRPDISTADVEGIAKAQGVLTAVGSRTAHAAVVARNLDKVCLVGCAELTVEPEARRGRIGGVPLAEGDELTLDGGTGCVYRGRLPVISERPEADLAEVDRWRSSEHAPVLVA